MVPLCRRVARWLVDHLLWDTNGTSRHGFWGGVWATRKLWVAFAAAAFLTWQEWIRNHPPEIALVAIIHFVFVLAVIALLIYAAQWIRRMTRP